MSLLDHAGDKALFVLGCCLFLANLCLFIAMGADKLKAKRGGRRIPEARLFLLALLGGSAGGILGMYCFRHKTRHASFRIGFPLILLFQLALALLLIYIR